MKTENNHTNTTIASNSVESNQTKTTLWTKVKELANASLPVITGIMWGAVIVSVITLFALISVISTRQGECDFIGEKVEVRSEYRKSSGCNLLINGNWTPLSELVITVDKIKASK